MFHIFIDLEMNEVLNREGTNKCKNEVIQIGAIKLDEKLKKVDTFNIYIKPKENKILDKIEKLTGISNEKVKDAIYFNEAMDLFLDWIGEDFKIYAWSGNDYLQLKYESKYKNYTNPKLKIMLKRWKDFQREFCKLLDLDKGYQISLDMALNIVDIKFKGNRHNALDDAINTSILFKITRNKDKFKSEYSYIKETLCLKKKEPFCTFGDFLTEDILKCFGGEGEDEA